MSMHDSANSLKGLAANAIARGVAGVFVLKVVALGLGFLVNVLLARWLAPEGFGSYTFAFTVVTLLSMPMRNGLGSLLVRQIAVYQKREQWALLRGVLKASNLLTLFFALACVAVLLVAAARGADARLWVWCALLVPLYSLGGLRGSALRGLRKPLHGQLPEHLLRPALFLALLLVWGAMAARPLDPAAAMGMHAGAMAIAFLAGMLMLVKSLPPGTRDVAAAYAWPEWLRSLLPFTLLAGMQVINGSLDVIMLGVLSTPAEVGQFRAGEQFASLVGVSMLAVNMVLTPELARSFAANELDRAQRLVRKSAIATAAIAFPVALLLCVAGGPVLSLTYGAAYVPAWPVLAILAVGTFVSAFCGPVGSILNMAGFERESVYAVLAALILNAILNLWLVPRLGATGAAIGTAASMVTWNIILAWRVRKRTGLAATAFGGTRRAPS